MRGSTEESRKEGESLDASRSLATGGPVVDEVLAGSQ